MKQGLALGRDLIGGIDVICVAAARVYEIDAWMRLPVARVIIVFQRREHRAVIHAVTVNDGIEAAPVGGAARVHEDRTDGAAAAVPCMREVVVVVRALHERIGDRGIRDGQPAEHIGVHRLKGSKVDACERVCLRLGRGFGRRLRGGCFGRGFRRRLGQLCDFGGLLVGCVAGPVVKQLMDEHSAADDQDGRQSKRQDKAHSFHDSLISVR